MSNNNAYSSKVLWGVLFTVLFAFPGLVSCGGGGGSTTANTNSTPPAVFLSATLTSIPYGATTTLNWSSENSTGCTLSGGEFIPGPGTLFGPIPSSQPTSPLTLNTTYTVKCAGAGGQTTSQDINITVASSAFSAVISSFADAGGGKVTVTTANTLTNGFAVTISGTTSYDGTYTVENRTATTFEIVHAFVASETGIWQLAGGMFPGCSTTGSTGTITLSNAPSRFDGVAPLAVFFDASNTTAITTTRPFHDLEYRWDFGDQTKNILNEYVLNLSPPLVGTHTWNTGSRAGSSSRNTATGPVSAHVYETPGIYTVALSATDGTNTVSNSCAKIVVYDPEAVFSNTTACVANAAMPVAGTDGCPAVATLLYNSNDFDAAMTTALAAGARRILFRRGDTFVSNVSNNTVGSAGPGVIGAYGGSGNLPIISMTGTQQWLTAIRFNLSGYDWRVMDLNIDGAGTNDNRGIVGNSIQTTILRVTSTNLNGNVDMNNADQLAVVDSNFSLGGTGSFGSNYGVWCATCTNAMLLGNNMFLDTINSHNIRLQGVVNFVVSNSTQTGSERIEPITIRGNTQYVVLADNKFVDNIVTVKPQSVGHNEHQQDIIFERNWFAAGSHTLPSLSLEGSSITVRNNIFDVSLAAGYRAISLGYINTVGSPMPDLINIYNNTIYNSTTNDGNMNAFYGIRYAGLDATCHSEVKNNLAYSPNTTGTIPVLIFNLSACNITGGSGTFGNSSDFQIKNTSPNFANPTPSNPAGFNITAESYAHDTGVTVPVFSDFFRTGRPQGGSIDMGAIEGP